MKLFEWLVLDNNLSSKVTFTHHICLNHKTVPNLDADAVLNFLDAKLENHIILERTVQYYWFSFFYQQLKMMIY